MLSDIPLDDKTLIMPVLLNRCHWCLIWVNIRSKLYRFFDPRHFSDSGRYFELIMDYLRFYNEFANMETDLNGWSTMQLKNALPEQNDTSNCGVYVIFYTFYPLQLEKNCIVDTCAFRKKIARFILENAPNMRHLCGICGRDESWRPAELFEKDKRDIEEKKTPTSMSTMVRCEKCRRWIHHCCDRNIKTVPFKEICSESYVYHCETCKAYAGKGMNSCVVQSAKI